MIGVHTGAHGAFAEYIVVPAANVVELASGVPTAHGSLTRSLAVGLHAVPCADVGPGDTLAVIGAGMIGLAVVLAAFADGAREVIVSDLDPSKLAIAEALGAVAVHPPGRSLGAAVRERTGPDGVDCTIDAIGATTTMASATAVTRRGGTVCLLGTATPLLDLDSCAVSSSERRIVGSFYYSDHHFAEASARLDRDRNHAQLLISRRIGLTQAPAEFAALAHGRSASVKTVLSPGLPA